jgi:hypothetical protein
MLRLLSVRRGGALTELAPRGFAGPCARVDLANHIQPFLGFGEGGEVTHVQSKALATFLEAAADKEGKAPQLRQIGLRQRHGRCR